MYAQNPDSVSESKRTFWAAKYMERYRSGYNGPDSKSCYLPQKLNKLSLGGVSKWS